MVTKTTDPRTDILRLFHGLPLEQRADFWKRMGRFPIGEGLSAVEALTAELVADEFRTEYVPIDSICPSPENDELYGAIEHDEQMDALAISIDNRGLRDPILISEDNYIISGHRRYYACCWLELEEVAVRREPFRRDDNLEDWPKLLAEFNCQRVKTAGMLLREALMRHSDSDPSELLAEHRLASIQVDATFSEVEGVKYSGAITEKKRPFLVAAQKAVDELKKFWPLTVRQVHYRLLNNPPLITTPKRSQFEVEHYRYRNDKTSYQALIKLLSQARYAGEIPANCIDDPTRPKWAHNGFRSLAHFLDSEMANFLTGYHRHRQLDQPRHIEMLGEKNTLAGIVRPICRDYGIPLTLGRGYASYPVWRDMAARFKESGKAAMTLIIASDYDPEGLDLADDAIRSLRDMWMIRVDYHRVSVTAEQIAELDLSEDFNPAKETSSRLESFIRKSGGTKTWELESLPPEYLQEQVRAAIEANMDMAIYQQTVDQEREDVIELARIRAEIVSDFNL